MQSQVRFNRVPEKVPEKVSGSLGAKPSQVQRVPEKVAEAKPGQVHLAHGNPTEVFPALGFPARLRKICKDKALRLLGIPPKLIFFITVILSPPPSPPREKRKNNKLEARRTATLPPPELGFCS